VSATEGQVLSNVNRREFLIKAGTVVSLGIVGTSGAVALYLKLFQQGSSSPSGSDSSQQLVSSQTAPSVSSGAVSSGYIFVTDLSALSGKTSAYFNHPTFGSSILLNYGGSWKAFSSVCTHAGCTVNFNGSQIVCPCHNGYFSAQNGSVTGGPPPSRLPEYGVQIVGTSLYVGNSVIN
jgi:Rieske Fe-S protein